MGFFDALFQPGLLLFTVPVLIAVMLWSLALIGLLDFESFDFDLDADVNADFDADLEAGGGSGVLAAMGLGLVPFSLILTLILFFFGFTGITLHSFFGGALGWSMAATNLLFAPLALLVAIVFSAGAARALHPLFRDYGKAHGAFDLIGKTAVLKTSTVSPTFGAAVVKIDGDRLEIATRSETEDNGLRYGDKVLVIDFDQENNIYLVAPFKQKMVEG